MLHTRILTQTRESIDNVFKIFEGWCKEINANIKYVNEREYELVCKSGHPNGDIIEWNFNIVLRQNKKWTNIGIFIEFHGIFKPSKRIIDTFISLLEKKISTHLIQILNT